MKTRHIILAQFVFIINVLNLVCHLLDSEPCQIRTFNDYDHFDDDDDNIDGKDDPNKDNLNKDSHNKQNHKEDNQDKYNPDPLGYFWIFPIMLLSAHFERFIGVRYAGCLVFVQCLFSFLLHAVQISELK